MIENIALLLQVDNKAVGFMSVCSEVNVALLNRCYELGPFHGLRKPHDEDITHPAEDDLDEAVIPKLQRREEGQFGEFFIKCTFFKQISVSSDIFRSN